MVMSILVQLVMVPKLTPVNQSSVQDVTSQEKNTPLPAIKNVLASNQNLSTSKTEKNSPFTKIVTSKETMSFIMKIKNVLILALQPSSKKD